MAVAEKDLNQPTGGHNPGWLAKLVGANSHFQTRKALWGYAFALPWIIGLIVFWGGPILASFYFSFTEYGVTNSPTFIGLENYRQCIHPGRSLLVLSGRTFLLRYRLCAGGHRWGARLGRSAQSEIEGHEYLSDRSFLSPTCCRQWPLPSSGPSCFHPSLGPVNQFLRAIGIDNPPAWLSSRDTALASVTMINVWAAMGGNAMLIFLAGLQGVPQELYEAADIDGAGAWSKVPQRDTCRC